MNSKKIRWLLWSGTTVLCLAVMSGCRRSGDVGRAAAEKAPPWTLTLAAPIHYLDVVAREPMIVEHPDGTLFVGGYGAAFMSGRETDDATLWKSRDGGATWARVNVGTKADGAAGNSDVDLAVARDGTLYFATLIFDDKAMEGKQISIGVSKDVGMTWKWTLLSKTRFDDRPWVKVTPDGTAHVIWNDGSGVCHAVSLDGSLTWTERARIHPKGGSSHLAVGPNGEVAVRVTPTSAAGPKYDEGVDLVAVSTDGGTTWRKQAAPGYREWNPDYFPVPRWVEPLAWDARGALYSLWTNLKGVWLARSVDRGETWTTWQLKECPEVAYYPYLVARGQGELAATWFSGWTGTWQAHAARIDVSADGAPPRMVESPSFRPDSWRQNQTWPEDPQTPDPAGEYLAVSFLRAGGLVVVSPIQNKRENRYGFSLWRVEERRGESKDARAEERPLATKVEHFFVVSDQAQSLFAYFKDEFRLPEVWPFYTHGTFASGGLSLGNAVLEFVSFPKEGHQPQKTEFRGIAFEPKADADATAAELTRRNIPHSDVRSYKSQIPGRQILAEWSSVGLTDFPPTTADVFFCDYQDRQSVADRRKAARDELAARTGGPLGIVAVAEITVGVQDLEDARNKWTALLKPSPQISDDAFVFNTGPRIHLVHAESPGIQGIALSVRSLGEAEKFLKERRLLAKDDAGHIAISPVAIDGLAIRLTAVTQAQDEVIFRTEVHADLVFHLLAHMDIGEDASSLYSPDYINMINREKARLAGATEPLEEKLAAAKKIYVPDQKLRMVNFLPFYCNGFESLWQGLKWLAEEEKGKSPNPDLSYFEQDFYSPEAKKFLSLFAFSMKSEYESFYKDYWERRQKELLPLKEKFSKFWRDKGLKFMRPAMRKYNKRCVIYLCLSMTQYGRGFVYPDIFGAAVKFPEIQEEILTSFFFSIHEMTHQFMDEITLKSAAAKPGAASTMSGSEGYQIHLLTEKAVIYADYLLCQKFLPEYLEDYVRFFLGPTENIKPAQNVSFSKSKSEEKFRERFTIPGPTLLALKEFVASLSDDY